MATLCEYYNTGYDDYSNSRGIYWRAQTFTPVLAHKITSVKLLLSRYGSPGTITVSIRATDGNGHPTGADLCSGTTNGNTLPTGSPYEWREITLGAGSNLTVSTKYAIVVRAPAGDGDNFVSWQMDSSSPTYAGGNREESSDSGSTWSSNTGSDFMFEDWGEVHEYFATLSAAIGLSPTLSRQTTYGRSQSVALGLSTTLVAEKKKFNWLCVASEDGGSIKTQDGTNWSVCAKDANGGLAAAWLAQYDNRLCALASRNAGFGYSSVNDIVANWTNAPNFPNLPQKFTGLFVGKDASDNPALYFLTPKGMYYLDVFTAMVFGPTELIWEEDNTSGKKGLYWKGDTYVAIGKGIYKMSQGVVTLVGPDMDDGLPEELQGTVTDMIGVGFWLVIAMDGGNAKKSCILKRYITGKHWHPVYVTGAINSPIRTLLWDSGTLYFGEGANVKSLPLPAVTDNINKLSTQPRCVSGSLTYPYFHSVFETMTKVAHKVWATTRDCNANEKITISYRKDEQMGWTELGSFTSSPRPTALSFGTGGLEFERIQLKATYARGGTITNSPKLESLILEYRVIPPTLWGWTMKVAARTSKDRKGEEIISALKTAIETGTLLSFFPSGSKDGTEYFVTVVGMPGTELGTEFGQEGLYKLTLQEVVG